MNTAIGRYLETAQDLYTLDPPFTIEDRLGGAVYLFDDAFKLKLRESLHSGCMTKLNDTEKLLLENYLAYSEGLIPPSPELDALDRVVMSFVTCEALPSAADCPLDSVHEFEVCP